MIDKDIKKRTITNKHDEPYKINQYIEARFVRVVGEGLENGIVTIKEALRIAEEKKLDLVEISPNGNPPVCKIMDYSKFKYAQKIKLKEAKASSLQKNIVKEIQFGPNTDEHDFKFKLVHVINFLVEKAKVRAHVYFQGRSIAYKERGENILNRLIKDVEEYGKPESPPKLEGRRLSVTISPKDKITGTTDKQLIKIKVGIH
ncbi:MAG: translation initiation factor IF-3 [Chitinophagaceae bacterium]|nr:translation initiation factor IF-3 [Chitinophagaceae bacterium]